MKKSMMVFAVLSVLYWLGTATFGWSDQSCERQCADFYAKGQLNKGITIEKCIEALCRDEREGLRIVPERTNLELLLDGLRSNNVDERLRAAQALRSLQDVRSVEGLTKALDDSDWRVRGVSVEALGKIGDKRASQGLSRRLESDSVLFVRLAAATALAEIKDPDTVNSLLKVLRAREKFSLKGEMIRRGTLNAWSWAGVQSMVELLGTDAEGYLLPLTTAFTLIKIGDQRAIEDFLKILSNESEPELFRLMVAEGLSKFNDKRVIIGLMGQLKNNSAMMRGVAAQSLGELKALEAAGALKELYQRESSPLVQGIIVFAAGQINGLSSMEILLSALKSADEMTRRNAVILLRGFGGLKVIDGLVAISLTDESAEIRAQAVNSLGEIQDSMAIEGLLKTALDASPSVRAKVATVLGVIRDEKVKPILKKMLQDDSEEVRNSAKKALDRLSVAETFRAIFGISPVKNSLLRIGSELKGKDASAQKKAERIFQAILIDGLKADQDVRIKGEAARALGFIGDSRSLDILMALASKESPSEVRFYAVGALGHLGDPRAIPILLTALTDEKKNLSLLAEMALDDIRVYQATVEPTRGK